MEQNALLSLQHSEAQSTSIVSTELLLNETIKRDMGVLDSSFDKIFPLFNNSDHTLPLEFYIGPSQYYLDLSEIYLVVEGKVVTNTGATVPAATGIVPVSNALHGLFSEFELYINNIPIVKNSSNYNYLAYLSRLFLTSDELKKTKFATEFWHEDDKADHFTDANPGYKQRKALSKDSANVSLFGRIEHGMLNGNCRKYLKNGTSLRLRFKRTSPSNYLEGPTLAATAVFNHQFSISNCHLLLRKCIIHPQIAATHDKLLSSGKRISYNFVESSVTNFNLQTGTTLYLSETINQGPLPQTIILTILDSKRYAGAYNLSKFNFSHSNINKVRLLLDGEEIIYKSLEFGNDENNYQLPYLMSFNALPATAASHGITLKDFSLKSFGLVINLLPGNRSEPYQAQKTGNLRVEIGFKTGVTEQQTVLVLCQHNRTCSLDKFDNVYLS